MSLQAVKRMAVVAGILFAPNLAKADTYGNNGGTALDQAASWVDETTNTNPALTPPGAGDIALWDSLSNLGTQTYNLDLPTSWLGIAISSASGNVVIGGGGDTGNTLTMGASGINLSAATQNLTINDPLAVGAGQTWNVASGRTLLISDITVAASGAGTVLGGNTLTIAGAGATVFGTTSNALQTTADTNSITGGGSIVKNGTGALWIGTAANAITNVTVNNGTFNINMAPASANGAAAAANVPVGAIITAGGNVLTQGGSRLSGSLGNFAYVENPSGLSVQAGDTSFLQTRGSSARTIDQFSGTPTRAAGATVNFTDTITNSTGANNANGGGYRLGTGPLVNGVVPWLTYTTTTANSAPGGSLIPLNPLAQSWFVAAGTSNNGTAYAAYTASTDITLGTATQNVDVVNGATTSNANITGLGATIVNTIRFNSGNSHSVTMGATDSLTVGAGGILVTGAYANHKATITGGTLAGGNPGSGSANDLMIIDYADPNAGSNALIQIDSAIIDNTTNANAAGLATALTKSGTGTLVLTSANSSYTGNTYLNDGIVRISAEGATTGSLGAVPVSTVANNLIFTGGTLQLGASINLNSTRGITLRDKGGAYDTNGFASTYVGIITGTGPFTKSGLNTLRLTSANTYTGNTTISGGTLAAVNATGSATGSGTVNVSAGGILGGSGTVTGLVNLSAGTGSGGTGGHVAPGDGGVGTLSVGAISLVSGSAADIEFASTSSFDQLNVLNSSGLTLNGGGVDVYTAGTTSPFSPSGDHTFNLFHYTGTLNGDPTSLSVLNPVNGFSYTFGASGGFVTLEINGTGGVIVSSWNKDADGLSWNTTANWTAGIPHGPGDSATFGNVITADRSIAVDSAQTLGSLTFNNAHSYTLAPGAAGSIAMDNTGGTGNPTITVTGSHFITAPVTFNADTTITTNNPSDSLTLGSLHGNGGLLTAGFGTVVLTGAANDYSGNTTIAANTTLQIGNATNPTTGSLGSSSLHDNGTFRVNRSNAYVINNNIDGTGSLVQAGTGATTLNGGNSYQGGTTITSGTVVMGNSSALGTGAIAMTTPGLLDVNGTGPSLPGVSGSGTIDNTNINPTQITFTNAAGTSTFSGVIQNTGGQVSIDKQGAGTQALNGVNTYTGNTTIDSGNLSINSDASLGVGGAVTINTGTLEINGTFSTARTINLSGAPSSIQVDGAQIFTYNNVAGLAGGAFTKTGTGTMQVTGPLAISGNLIVSNGILEPQAATGNSVTGSTAIAGGTGATQATLLIDSTASLTLPSISIGTSTSAIGLLHVNGGTFAVTGSTTINGVSQSGGGGNITIDGATSNVTFGAVNFSASADGSTMTVNNGTVTMGAVTLGRTGVTGSGTTTVPSFIHGMILNGGTVTMASLALGTANSWGTLSVTGTANATVSGAFTVGNQSTATRGGAVQVTGGTLTSTDPGGMQMAGVANNKALANFTGGTSSFEEFNMFPNGSTGATAIVTVGGANGGAVYVDAGGIQADFSSGTNTGSVVMAPGSSTAGGILGATNDWSSNVPFTLTDTTGRTSLKAADVNNVAHNITLNALINGAGNLVKTGGGTLTVNSPNSTYLGGTVVKNGILLAGAAAVPATTLTATTNLNTTVNLTDTTGLFVGQSVAGDDIPANTTITAIDSGSNSVTISNAATQSESSPLTFGAHSALGTGPLVMGGGTLNTGGFNQSATTLRTTAGSTIDLNTGNTGEVLSLANSSLVHWNPGTTTSGATLHIADWNGNAASGGGLDQIVFPGSSLAAPPLSGNQLNQIVFDGSGFTHAALVAVAGGTELVPTNTAPSGVLTLGDINQDGVVNVKDISALMSALSDLVGYESGTATYSGTLTPIRTTGGVFGAVQLMNVADLNLDGVVNNTDIQGLITYIANGDTFPTGGGGGSVTAVPEPASCVLLALGGTALLAGSYRRRRGLRRV